MGRSIPNPHADSDLAPLVAEFYATAPAAARATLVSTLLEPLGTLAFAAVAAGAFARFLPERRAFALTVTPEAVDSISPLQVEELARYVEQVEPELLSQLPQLTSTIEDNTTCTATSARKLAPAARLL